MSCPRQSIGTTYTFPHLSARYLLREIAEHPSMEGADSPRSLHQAPVAQPFVAPGFEIFGWVREIGIGQSVENRRFFGTAADAQATSDTAGGVHHGQLFIVD